MAAVGDAPGPFGALWDAEAARQRRKRPLGHRPLELPPHLPQLPRQVPLLHHESLERLDPRHRPGLDEGVVCDLGPLPRVAGDEAQHLLEASELGDQQVPDLGLQGGEAGVIDLRGGQLAEALGEGVDGVAASSEDPPSETSRASWAAPGVRPLQDLPLVRDAAPGASAATKHLADLPVAGDPRSSRPPARSGRAPAGRTTGPGCPLSAHRQRPPPSTRSVGAPRGAPPPGWAAPAPRGPRPHPRRPISPGERQRRPSSGRGRDRPPSPLPSPVRTAHCRHANRELAVPRQTAAHAPRFMRHRLAPWAGRASVTSPPETPPCRSPCRRDRHP